MRTDTATRRFQMTTYREALEKAKDRPTWIIDGVISAHTTLLVGEAKVGKSFLASALIASLSTGEDFIGKPVPQDRDFSVAVCWTDDAGDVEYGERIATVMPGEAEPNVGFYAVHSMERREDWQDLFREVMADGRNFVIIDNLSQCIDGSYNDDHSVRKFYDGVRLFTRVGIPVVIIAHSTDKAGPNGQKSEKPMGSAYITQAARWRCFVRRSRKGNMTLKFMGNYTDAHEITVHHGAGARFTVLAANDVDENGKPKKAVSEERLEWATFLDGKQFTSYSAAAQAIKDQFPDAPAVSTLKNRFSDGAIPGRLVEGTYDRYARA
ncbi:AAA family ATPase [Actinoallomurus sp. NBC_01490]|uniref:AAA family ATPase n=1 Tax=Actinoallomurus sp. NBC_01490 TaxID=2903557 RepID=UPI002E365F66|nr:AAA family ATPase [Actinoallomurus sp. NBC_01490]